MTGCSEGGVSIGDAKNVDGQGVTSSQTGSDVDQVDSGSGSSELTESGTDSGIDTPGSNVTDGVTGTKTETDTETEPETDTDNRARD